VRTALRLAKRARWDGLDSLVERSWRLLDRTEDYDAWLVAWPPGANIELHDHGGSSGCVVAVSGELVETRAAPDGNGRYALHPRRIVAHGLPVTFSGWEVHDVSNHGSEGALSVHVYSQRLTRMTFYQLEGDTLAATRCDAVEDGEPEQRFP
jgi:predicted metal-dependent enzyme (double-stranded beta helix superfamily)